MSARTRSDDSKANQTPIRRRRTKLANDKKLSEDEFMAAAIGDVEWLRQSLRDGGGELHYDRNGLAPIHLAAVHGRLNCLKLLIEKFKVDVNLPSTTGWRPIHLAISNQTGKRSYTCLLYLLEKGADPSATNDDSVTPVHQAASEGHVQCLKLLVELGATIDCEDCRGHTPLDLAKLWGHRKVARLLAMEKWHKDKNFLTKELKQLEKVHMQHVLKEIEDDETNHVDQQFYGELAYREWLRKKGMENKTPQTREDKSPSGSAKDKKTKPVSREKLIQQQKIDKEIKQVSGEPVKPAKESLYKANSLQQPEVKVTKPQEASSEQDPRKRVEVVSKQSLDKGSVSPKLRSHTPMTKVSEESGDMGLHEKPEEFLSAKSPSENQLQDDTADKYYNTNPWNKSTKVRESEYQPILKDFYPRDEYTMLPVKPKTAPAGVRRLKTNLSEEDIEKLRQERDSSKKPLRMPKLPSETVERTLSGDIDRHHRPVMFKCKTMMDIHTKRKLDKQDRPKSEAVIHLSNAVESPLFQINLQPHLQRFLNAPSSAGSERSVLSVDSFIRSQLVYDLQRFTQQTHFPNIKGEEYEINTGKYAIA